ncbi:MAG: hypothetical protein ACP5KO_07945, partial [Caldimicrobium sp.]
TGFHKYDFYQIESKDNLKSQSLVNEGRFPQDELLEIFKNFLYEGRNPSLMRAGFHPSPQRACHS